MPLLTYASILGRVLVLLCVLLWPVPLVDGASQQPARTVFIIVLENHSWSQIAGSASATYINRTLLPAAARAGAYFTPPGLHPSLPNYLWLEAGTNFGIFNDVSPTHASQPATLHLVTLLDRAGISWRAYQQSISGKVCPLVDAYPYATKHNPMVYFDNVTNRLDPQSHYCIAHVRPQSELMSDLRHNSVARYNFITPDMCHDMHDPCSPIRDKIRQGDVYLSRVVPQIVSTRAYRQGGVLFLVWDEGGGDSDGPLGLLVLSPLAKHGYTGHVRYTHSSTLRSIEEIFGLRSMLGAARNSNDLRDLFTRFP